MDGDLLVTAGGSYMRIAPYRIILFANTVGID